MSNPATPEAKRRKRKQDSGDGSLSTPLAPMRQNSPKQKQAMIKDIVSGMLEPLYQEIAKLKQDLRDKDQHISKLQENITTLNNRQRLKNVKIFGAREVKGETYFDCKRNVLAMLQASGITLPPIAIEKALRVGPKTVNERPIVVNFSHLADRNFVFDKKEHIKKCCKVVIVEDFCQSTEEKRKELSPFVATINKAKNKDGKVAYKASLKHDKLLVNGTTFTKNTLPNLPSDIKPERLFTKTQNNITGFYRKWSPLSNHYRSQQTVHNIQYNCNEQYYFHEKAKFFGDPLRPQKKL